MPTQLECPTAPGAALGKYRHFVIGAMIYLFIFQCGVLFVSVPKSVGGLGDFRCFYTSGLMVRSGDAHHLYDLDLQDRMQNLVVPHQAVISFLYPALGALLFVPFSYLQWRASYFLFFALNFLLLWLAARLMRDSLPHLVKFWAPLPLLLFICFFPVGETLMQGQTSILLLLLYCAAFSSLQKHRDLRAGIFLGLAILKIQTALPIALLFLLWRRWRALTGFAAGAAATLVASLAVTGYATFVQYWKFMFHMAASASGSSPRFGVDPLMMANFYGLAHLIPVSAAWKAGLAAAASLLLLLWIASRPSSLPMALIGALLFSRYLGIYDLALLILPISLALDYAIAHPLDLRARAGAVVCAVLLLSPLYLSLMKWRLLPCLALVMLALLLTLPSQQPVSGT